MSNDQSWDAKKDEVWGRLVGAVPKRKSRKKAAGTPQKADKK